MTIYKNPGRAVTIDKMVPGALYAPFTDVHVFFADADVEFYWTISKIASYGLLYDLPTDSILMYLGERALVDGIMAAKCLQGEEIICVLRRGRMIDSSPIFYPLREP